MGFSPGNLRPTISPYLLYIRCLPYPTILQMWHSKFRARCVFKKLCQDLRDSDGEENIRRAADALRRYMQDQQFILRRRLAPSVEKAFMMMNADRHSPTNLELTRA